MLRESSMSMLVTFARARALALVLLAGLAACGGGGGSEFAPAPVGMTPGLVVPDWSAPDVNPASPLWNTLVSPRQRLGMTSAWYFAHAT